MFTWLCGCVYCIISVIFLKQTIFLLYQNPYKVFQTHPDTCTTLASALYHDRSLCMVTMACGRPVKVSNCETHTHTHTHRQESPAKRNGMASARNDNWKQQISISRNIKQALQSRASLGECVFHDGWTTLFPRPTVSVAFNVCKRPTHYTVTRSLSP